MYQLSKIIGNFVFIFMPHYWIMNYSYSKEWDKTLNKLLDTFNFMPDCDEYTATIGNQLIWIENYPCACFTPYGRGHASFRASRLTILRARFLLEKTLQKDPYLRYKKRYNL